jgi:hypothetical protein
MKMDDGFVATARTAEDVEKVADDQLVKNETEGIVRVQTSASEPELPFSRARTVALVTTVAAAPLLSVSPPLDVWSRHNLLTVAVQTMAVQASVIILPTIGEALDIPTSRQQWIVSAYNLTFGCFLVSAI